ncbi:hypothetical protein A2856_00380 [Candidatus Uhrbacteria bacterium RIFCSPHIGHO2_01_FULL_63_20]|uniref:(d)CMP kinase n=1 Tax=Candidatus Uhrbacteria bacterium RIFCSPHIGHO2_01_FULL_63_20 TaxID=1802385 RepID=A0A1F7TLT4_9BACT|nr:MAG: hypothetical protein A2856_00380 [Candidatus Uhrbacteria bacterium RIFCSPHIGHO2_01_FULL_63_20]
MVITLSGLPGSGKTTIASMLAERLGVNWYSMGDLRGKMAAERGLTIDQLNELGEKEAFTDKEVDDYQAKLGVSGESFVIDGRLSWHFIPDAFKVFLYVDPSVGAQRVIDSQKHKERPDEQAYVSVEDAERVLCARMESDQRRYQKYYGLDILKRDNYNLWIDTSKLTPQQIVATILAAVEARQA